MGAIPNSAPVGVAEERPRLAARIRMWFGWILFALAWVVVLRATFGFLQIAVPRYLVMMPESYGEHFWVRRPWILVHVMTGTLAVVTGPLQFWQGLRRRAPRAHRWTGRIYLGAIGIGGVASAVLGVRTEVSIGNTIGLTLMGIAWLFAAWTAYRYALKRRFHEHGLWMVRSYILTVAFVVFRLGDDVLHRFGVEPGVFRLTLMAWLCWVGPLLMFEVFRRVVPGPRFLAPPPRGDSASRRRG